MMRLFFRLLSSSIRSQMAHRASFWMLTLSYFISSFVGILGIWILFDRFEMVAGWTFQEVCIIYGTVHIGFSIAESFARGFDTFDQVIRYGDFDRLLLRPVGTLFQMATRHVQLLRLGRLLQGLIVLSYGWELISYSGLLIVACAVAGTAMLFYGLIVMQATLCFWTIETLEVMNITTFGGLEVSQYPMSIYPQGFLRFFTFVIPLSLVAYYPIASLLRHEPFSYLAALMMPLSGLLFLCLAGTLWRLGVKRYSSTGS